MAHNILGQRFYNNREQPAWHGIGVNTEEAHTAQDALRRLGIYKVEKRPMFAHFNGAMRKTDWYALMREPIPEDPEWRQFGTPVTEDYELVDPQACAAAWDEVVRDASGNAVPIETFGILGKGERIFISVKLPRTLDIRGDEVETYLLYDNPMTNGFSAGGYTTGVRVVCQNTLNAALRSTLQSFAVQHTPGAIDRLKKWLGQIYQTALVQTDILAESYNLLAATPANDDQARWVIERTYELPKMPDPTDPADRGTLHLEDRFKRYDREKDLIKRLREKAFSLWAGEGTGSTTAAVSGTAFGVWNAVTELETYRKGDLTKATAQLLNGARADRIQNAFTLSTQVGRWQTIGNADIGLKKVRV